MGHSGTRSFCLTLLIVLFLRVESACGFEPFADRARLERGGEVSGLVLDADDRRAIIEFQGFPTAVCFADMELPSAYRIRKRAMEAHRGTPRALTVRDHFELGQMAWLRGHRKLAEQEFAVVRHKDKQLAEVIDNLEKPRRSSRWNPDSILQRLDAPVAVAAPAISPDGAAAVRSKRKSDAAMYEAAVAFGASVGDKIGTSLDLLETEHFLIWTDWPRVDQEPLKIVCERLYAACAAQFGLDPSDNVFAGKCSVFCFETRAKFLKFAREFDNYNNRSALAYTKTLPNGYARVVGYRSGETQAEMERFLSTLTHECVHAFVHRYRTTRSLPLWVSEGLANFLAARALGAFCPYEGDAAMVSKQVAVRKIAIDKLFETGRVPNAQEYPVAHSLLGYLLRRDAGAFAGFIDDLKDGQRLGRSLEMRYGETLESLESKWRSSVQAVD